MSINKTDLQLNVAKNLDLINQRIEASLKNGNRQKDDVKLIAVSKVQPVEKIEVALVEGHRLFGENRVQEAALKWPALKIKYPNAKPVSYTHLTLPTKRIV